MRQEQTTADISALLRARNTLLWIVSREELRVERALIGIAGELSMLPLFWDCSDGLTNGDGTAENAGLTDPLTALQTIGNDKRRALYVMRDLHKWFDPQVLRATRSLARKLQGVPRNEARAVIVLSPSAEIPPEIAGQVTVIDWPLPDREEMAAILDGIVESLDETLRAEALPVNGQREAAIDAAVGLTAEEAANSYARSLVTERKIDAGLVSAEKKRLIDREGGLTWHAPDPRGLDAVGGLDRLKVWLRTMGESFGAKARAYGVPSPKGVLLLGHSGTGKSKTAKAVAAAWQYPLLRLDLGAQKSKYVGESEANIRKAFNLAQTIAPCVLWIDEIEKAMAGATGPQGDGGVGADALSAMLNWLQEDSNGVFVIATANDISALPPELFRPGRFDGIFFVDLPTTQERGEIFGAAIAEYGRKAEDILGTGAENQLSLMNLIDATAGFTGAEIASTVPTALRVAFADGEREPTVSDLLTAARAVVPLSLTAKERVEELRRWAVGRCMFASTPESATTQSNTRNIEL